MGRLDHRGDAVESVLCEIGPLGVRSGSTWSPLHGERVGAVLALLSIAGDAGMRTAAIVDSVWPQPERPATARRSLANIVARLRSRFGPDFIETTGSGYRLGTGVASDRLWILETATSVEMTADGTDLHLESDVEDALHRWRGEPWVDISIDEAEPDRARLHAARATLLRAHAAALTRRGRHEPAVDALEELVRSGTHNEHDWYELARGLAVLGRRADGVARIREARRQLAARGHTIGAKLATLETELLEGSWSGGVPLRPPTDRSSPMLGRGPVLRRTSDLVDRRRLVTLVGPGGVGKTRLALELTERRPELSPLFVDLVPVRDGRFVTDAVAATLQADVEASGSAMEAVVGELRAHPRLVVLDNCEQIVEAAAGLAAELTARCPETRVLATSRQALGLDGEFVVELTPLDTGAGGAGVALFFQRAAESGVELDEVEWQSTVAELCRRIDGLPLAIELAARRVTVLTPEEIVAGLADRFELLRSAEPSHRHSALSTTLLWSWDLLDADEQDVLCRLAAFASGVDTQELGAALELGQWRAVDIVQRLRSKSLVSVERGSSRPSRVHLLESVRMLAIEQASDRSIWSSCRRAHLRWVDDFTARVVGPLGDHEEDDDPMARLDGEGSEIRSAIQWAEGEPGRALAICARTVNWWRARDMASYAIERFEELLGRPGAVDVPVRANALVTLVLMRRIAGFPAARTADLAREARHLIDDIEDEAIRDRLELRYFESAFDVDDPQVPGRIRGIIDRTRARGEAVDTLAPHLLTAWYVANDPVAASALAVEFSSTIHTPVLARQAHAWEQCGLVALATGDLERARQFLEGALERFEAVGQRFCSVHGCESIAWLLAARGETVASRELFAATEGLRVRYHRYRSGFEEPAVIALVERLGECPAPDPDALLDATIETARAHLAGTEPAAG